MPVEVVNAVQKRCQTGKMPAWMRKMKKSRDLSCNQLGEAVASMVENKRKRGRTKVAGKAGDESVLHLYGGDDWVWILASEPDTRLRGLEGERYLVDPTAHMASLPQWLKVAEGHMDHKPDLQKSIQIGEAKFDVDRGLYLKVRSDDNELLSDIKSGAVLPSIEIDVNQDDVLENNLIDYYTPVGLGLMKENEPMGNSVGPEKPNDRFSVPMYAGELNMAEETEKAEEPKTEEDAPVKTEVEPPAEPEVTEEPKVESRDELAVLKAAKKELEDKLEEVLDQVDSKASAEEELKKIYLSKIPESIHKDVDALDLTTLKAFAKLSDHFQTQIEDTTRLEEAPVINETDSVGSEEGIDSDGKMTDKLFYSLKIKHAKANGMKYPDEWERYIN